ncbi:hypothetical protein [Methylobacterium phyllostachyos]|nr:hypothetical protein [Methylobacterium phyllostachyos]
MPAATDAQSLKLTLLLAPDDGPKNGREAQDAIAGVSRELHQSGVSYSQRGMAFDSVDAVGFALPEYIIPLAQAVGPTLGVILVAWLQGRAGRKVRLKVGDVEAEARTADEVERLLNKAAEMQRAKDEPKGG